MIAQLEAFGALPKEAVSSGDVKATLGQRIAEYRSITGSTVLNVDVDWKSLSAEEEKTFDSVCLHRIAMGLRSLCSDNIAKDSLSKGLTHIHIKSGSPASATLQGNTLHLVGKWSDLSQSPSDNAVRVALDNGFRVTYQRMLQRVVQEQIPTREKEILTEFNATVALKPDLASFTTPTSLEFLDNVGFLRLMMAIRTAAADPTSKEMIGKALKVVTFHNVHSDNDYAVEFNPATGVLRLACQVDRQEASTGSKILKFLRS